VSIRAKLKSCRNDIAYLIIPPIGTFIAGVILASNYFIWRGCS